MRLGGCVSRVLGLHYRYGDSALNNSVLFSRPAVGRPIANRPTVRSGGATPIASPFRLMSLAVAVSLVSAAPAYAACNPAALTGDWDAYLTSIDGPSPSVRACKFSVARGGVIYDGFCADSGAGGIPDTMTGKLQMSEACDVSGQFKISTGSRYTITQATFRTGTVAGIGAPTFSFTMLKN